MPAVAAVAHARRQAKTPLSRGDVELFIDDISVDGDGVGRVGNDIVHVPYTIPGERVLARMHPSRRVPAVATLTQVLEASPHRVEPRCPHFARPAKSPSETSGRGSRPADSPAASPPCGGCSWQHISYAEQLRLKTALVARLIRAHVPSAPPVAPIRTAHAESPWGYRHKVHFVLGPSDTPRGGRDVVLGHYARFSRRLVAVTECPVHDPRGNALAFDLHAEFRRAGVEAGNRGALQSIAVRTALATGERMATIVVGHDRDQKLRAATRRAIAAAAPGTSFHINVHDEGDSLIFGGRTRMLNGPARLRDEVLGSSYLVSPTSFFQTNVAAAELLVRVVLEAAPTTPSRVVDLYAGAGLFAIPLARAGHRVTAVETSRTAVADGRASAHLNRLTEAQCRFVGANVEQALASLGPVDLALLDPPRTGCDAAVVARLFGRLRPPRAIYVSCNPEALATDLAAIGRYGYRAHAIMPVDMFPHTPHVETVVVLAR